MLLAFLSAAAFIQANNFSVFDITPNLVLASLLASIFFISGFFEAALLFILPVFIIKFAPGFQLETLLIYILPLFIFSIKDFLPWRQTLNFLISSIFSLFAFYLLISPRLVASVAFAKDMGLYLFFALVFYFFLDCFFSDRKSHPFRMRKKSL